MIRSISKTVYMYPGDTATIVISLLEKLADHANFSIESANPNGYWGTSIPQLPKSTKVPREMIVKPFSGVVHKDEKEKQIQIKYLYPTWVRVVQYLSEEEIPTATAKIAVDTTLKTKILRWWRGEDIDEAYERIY